MKLKLTGFSCMVLSSLTMAYMIFGLNIMNEFNLAYVMSFISLIAVFNFGLSLLFLQQPFEKRKKTAFVFLIVCIVVLLTGYYFKINHWKGASVLLIEGIFLICFTYLPLLVLNRFQKWKMHTENRLLLIALCTADVLGLLFFFLGYLFRIQHWPGGYLMNVVGIIFIIISVLGWNQVISNIVLKRKEAEDKLARAYEELNGKHELLEEKQKEILDSIHYAKRIQKAILPSDKYLEKFLNRQK